MGDTMTPLFHIGAGVIYLGTAGLLMRQLSVHDDTGQAPVRRIVQGFAMLAILLHALALFAAVHTDGAINLGFTNASSLVTWVIALLFLIATLSQPIESLGVVILPLAGVAVLSQWLWPATAASQVATDNAAFTVHLIISMLAYAYLTMAVAQAILFAIQEKRFRERHPGRLLHALPPLQTMERLLFHLIGAGFVLLTASVISGAVFTQERFGTIFVVKHHTVLAFVAWAVFGTLLLGRWRFGWRGQNAVRWTVGGFTILLLGYFGTKFILEFVIG